MYSSGMPFIKVCCIENSEEATLAVAAGASALGLVSAMPSGPGVIDDQDIAAIAATVPPHVATFLLTSRQDADSIIEQHRHCRTTTIQLVDHVAHAELHKLRERLPGVQIVQVIHVTGEASLEQAISVSTLVDALLLDSGNPDLAEKELGGTGRTHDWRLSRRIRDAVKTPLFLAGGLNAGNIAAALSAVEPFGIDLCSSVRSDGRLDGNKLQAFFTAAADNWNSGARRQL